MVRLLVEGDTEERALPLLVERFLRGRGVTAGRPAKKNYRGIDRLIDALPDEVPRFLRDEPERQIVVIADFIGLRSEARGAGDLDTQVESARDWIASRVPATCRPSVSVHLLVHEYEALLLADAGALPFALPAELRSKDPERINLTSSPSSRLVELFWRQKKRRFRKTTEGVSWLGKADPEVIYRRCPNVRGLLDEVLEHYGGEPSGLYPGAD